ncbi:hypothetical protein BJX99DRAFT_76308 [Aspergillus californicus]
MPLRRPTSPLTLETCSLSGPDIDDYGLAGSDDELDECQRSEQRRRIEKLGEAYLQGQSLFILSASLRGPLHKGWVNPWKKKRRKTTETSDHKGLPEQPVIPETNSRKRRLYVSPSVNSRSRSSVTPQTSTRPERIRESMTRTDTRYQASGLETANADGQSPRSTHYKPTDTKWLRKDNVSTRFQTIDPPTSPTTSVSSRYLKAKGDATSSKSTGGSGNPDLESVKSPNNYRSKHAKHSEREYRPRLGPEPALSSEKRYTPMSKQPIDDIGSKGHGSIHVVSSSSQLPKFEYRLKQHDNSVAKQKDRASPAAEDNHPAETLAVGSNSASNKPENARQEPLSGHNSDVGEIEAGNQSNLTGSLAFTNASNTIENPSSANLQKPVAITSKDGTTSENNLPSAQHGQGNPPFPDNLTSLYSIAVSKATTNRTEDHNLDQQFSTQAAFMNAQRSFQNDLDSPEQSPLLSARKRHASHGSKNSSPNAVNITPFHQLNTTDGDIANRLSAPRTKEMPMMSTQYMMDAATPFTFSTEKKAGFRLISSEKEMSRTKKRKTTSFALASPSEASSDCLEPNENHHEITMQQQPGDIRRSPRGSPQSGLPMTLTGTTPPTVQEGQGVDSFNLSQAIAEAGSWLQQSFEINRDITQCQNTKLPQISSADSTR